MVVWCNDEFFAPAERLLAAGPAAHDPTEFGPRGKVYDGWETRRRRVAGEDSVIVRLAAPGLIRAVDIDTSFFRGNAPTNARVEGSSALGYPGVDELQAADWFPVVTDSVIAADSPNLFDAVAGERLCTHLRLTIRPDGGVARLRAYGAALPDPRFLGGRVDLAATVNGGLIVDCSNKFYAVPDNVLAPGRASVMSDGWETTRRRDDGNDWLIVSLGLAGVLRDVVIDTGRFIGNCPGSAQLSDVDTGEVLLPRTALLPDLEHRFRLKGLGRTSRVRLDVYPDGGLSRLRVHGEILAEDRAAYAERWLALLPPGVASVVALDELSK
jgi:allantoicase